MGTYPIHRQELIDLWMSLQEGKSIEKSLYSWEEMKTLVRQWQDQGDTVVLLMDALIFFIEGILRTLARSGSTR